MTPDTTAQIDPYDFGSAHHGIHLFDDEDGDWFAYGHHDARRVAAAMNSYARANGFDVAGLTLSDVRDRMRHCWGHNVRSDNEGIWWQRCDEGTPGAFPYTLVQP